MKLKVLLMVVFAVLLVATSASAQKNKVQTFSGTEYFDPFGLMGAPTGALLPSESSIVCPGHEPTGDPLQPCPEGSRIHTRNVKIMSRYVSSTASLSSGWMTIVMNSNLDADYTGPSWGTFSLAADTGGTLEGSWQGVRVKEGNHWLLPLHAEAFGTGSMDGMHALISDRIVEYMPSGLVYVGAVEGRLFAR